MSAVHASILRQGSGLSTNGSSNAIAILNPFTLSLSKPVLSVSKGANTHHFKKEHYRCERTYTLIPETLNLKLIRRRGGL
jgi:hypothetical protein